MHWLEGPIKVILLSSQNSTNSGSQQEIHIPDELRPRHFALPQSELFQSSNNSPGPLAGLFIGFIGELYMQCIFIRLE